MQDSLVLLQESVRHVNHVWTTWCPAPLQSALVWLWQLLVIYPTSLLYFYGPSFLGGWSGQTPSQVCAQLTTVEASFWENNPQPCLELVQRHFYSFHFTLCVMLYFLFINLVLYRLLRRLF